MRRAVLPDILVQAAENIDERALFKLHLFDALTYRAKGFYREVYPSGVVFGAGVVHLFADAEPDTLPVFGEFESRRAVISLGDLIFIRTALHINAFKIIKQIIFVG